MARKSPNIILTGTPGVGKTTHAEQLARATGLKHVSVNQIVKDEGFHEGKDEETGSWIVDEDKVTCLSAPYYPYIILICLIPQLLDYLEERKISEEGGSILDWHACDLFPERWIEPLAASTVARPWSSRCRVATFSRVASRPWSQSSGLPGAVAST